MRHAARLRWAIDTLATHTPFDPRSFAALTPVELAVCDQFIIRFSKLQDAMGTRLLPALLELAGELGEMPTFIDKLNRLEKIGAIRSAQEWHELRHMRNQFAHDYPDDPALQASLFNRALELANALLEILESADAFAQRLS